MAEQETFTDKDYLNFRYFDKKAAYLHSLQTFLRKQLQDCQVDVDHLHGVDFLPCLIIKPKEDHDASQGTKCAIPRGFQVRILACVSSNWIPLAKLTPERNSVRGVNQLVPTSASDHMVATPLYNQCILEDMFLVRHLKVIFNALARCSAAIEAIKLLKVWIIANFVHSRDG